MEISQILNIHSTLLLFFLGVLVLVNRRNFKMYNGIIILFVSLGFFPFTTWLESSMDSIVIHKFQLVSKGILPIFILLFSEYVLKAKYHVAIKFSVLIPTLILPFAALFNSVLSVPEYLLSMEIFMLYTFSMVLLSCVKELIVSNGPLLKKYLITFCVFMIYAVLFALNQLVKFDDSLLFSVGSFSFLGAHCIVIIISSGGTIRYFQKMKQITFGILFSLTITSSLFFFDPGIHRDDLKILLVLSVFLLSYYYFWVELRVNPDRISSARLIADLLSLNMDNRKKLMAKIRSWDQISNLTYVTTSELVGDYEDLLAIFRQTGRIIHKHQLKNINKNVEGKFQVKGIEILNYYFKTLECDSIYQMSHEGDFASLSYMEGFNPALHEKEMDILGKIVFAVANSKEG